MTDRHGADVVGYVFCMCFGIKSVWYVDFL